MAGTLEFVFRLLHILSAVLWVGGAALWTMIIAPRVLQRGPPTLRRPFLEAALPGVTRFMMSSAILTIVAGFITFGFIVGWDRYFAGFQDGAYGTAMGVGALLSIAMAVDGFAVVAPTGKKLLATMQAIPPGQPPSKEQQAQLEALGKKVGIAGMMSFVLGLLALVAMVYAVNLVR